MTGRLPVLKAGELIRALRKAGFELARTKGSHHVFDHRDDSARTVIVPVHSGRDLKIGTLRSIIAQSGLTVDEFKALL
jgi:predicted RNA binding protein YcfA (HicA-like mRNA interferase family)